MRGSGDERDAFERAWGLGPYYEGPYISGYETHIWVRAASHGVDGSLMTAHQKFALMLVAEQTGPFPRDCWSVHGLARLACMPPAEMREAMEWLVRHRFINGAVFVGDHLIGNLSCPLEVEAAPSRSADSERRKQRIAAAKAAGRHTRAEWVALVQFCGKRCLACTEEAELTKDHIVPIANGGDHSISNVQPVCFACNSSKGVRPWGDLRPAGWSEAVKKGAAA